MAMSSNASAFTIACGLIVQVTQVTELPLTQVTQLPFGIYLAVLPCTACKRVVPSTLACIISLLKVHVGRDAYRQTHPFDRVLLLRCHTLYTNLALQSSVSLQSQGTHARYVSQVEAEPGTQLPLWAGSLPEGGRAASGTGSLVLRCIG